MTKKNKGIFLLSNQKVFDFNNIEITMDLKEIFTSLSRQCRFTGHCNMFYSVLQHSILVKNILKYQGKSDLVQVYGLLHDTPEAITGDVSTVLKGLLNEKCEGWLSKIEDKIFKSIAKHINLPPITKKDKAIVKKADDIAKAIEFKELFNYKAFSSVDADYYYNEYPDKNKILPEQNPEIIERCVIACNGIISSHYFKSGLRFKDYTFSTNYNKMITLLEHGKQVIGLRNNFVTSFFKRNGGYGYKNVKVTVPYSHELNLQLFIKNCAENDVKFIDPVGE